MVALNFRVRSIVALAAGLGMALVAGIGAAEPVADMEQQIVARINAIRQQHNLPALQPDPTLRDVAREYSQTMARDSFFSHYSPSGRNVVDRVQAVGLCYRAVGENLARNYNVPHPIDAAVTGWMNSKGHRENILTPEYRETGVGVWRDGRTYWFTQVFFRAMPGEAGCGASVGKTPSPSPRPSDSHG